MTSIFPGEEREPQPAFNRDEVPAEVRLNFGHLLDWFTPNIFICWIILAINIVVFVAMLVFGFNPDHASPQALLKWGTDYGPATITQGQWWRIFTAIFIHLGILHVGFNMLVLAQIGPFMERLLGNIGFLIVYLTSGLAGSIASLAWNPYVFSAGASGAIFGLYGALIGFLILRRDSIPEAVLKGILKSAVFFLIYNAAFGFFSAGTDIAAHAGGLAGGLVFGLAISTPITAGFRQRRLLRASIAGLVSAGVLFMATALLPHPVDLQANITRFGVTEKKILADYSALLSHAKNAKDADLADSIQTKIMRPWSSERNSLAAVTGLPARQQHLLAVLLNYMDARQRAWTNLVQGLRTHNSDLIKQSFKQQMEAQDALKGSVESSH